METIALFIRGKLTPIELKSARFTKNHVSGITPDGREITIMYHQLACGV
jgi:hypothetical protein